MLQLDLFLKNSFNEFFFAFSLCFHMKQNKQGGQLTTCFAFSIFQKSALKLRRLVIIAWCDVMSQEALSSHLHISDDTSIQMLALPLLMVLFYPPSKRVKGWR